ncbi:MAG: hypothetical protein HC811_10740 [Flammeovirgaceae bacterium]|nr:hypothetical protein [Flammeovirgaceae bacterium]
MSPFDYVTILISIILGLGIAQLVTGVADIIHQQERLRLYWPHILWIPIIFFLIIQEWWDIYGLREYDTWRLPVFLFISLYPIALFILTRLLFPLSLTENSHLDFKHFYYKNYRRFFIVVVLTAFISGLENIFIADRGIEGILFQIIIIIVLSFIAFRKIENEFVHKIIVLAWFVVVVVSVAIKWNEWLISR